MNNALTTFSINSSLLQPPQNGTILTSKMLRITPYSPLPVATVSHLPSGPFSDDSIAMADLRVAMWTLGINPKHMTAIFFDPPFGKDDGPSTQIILFHQPGVQTRGPAGILSMSLTGNPPLISAYAQNGLANFASISRMRWFNPMYLVTLLKTRLDIMSGMPSISTMDNGDCTEPLRGARLSERSQKKPGVL